VAVKDLCDIEGEVTTAGSVVLSDRPPAVRDAPVVARLRGAGFIVLGRTNMTEFAYSGLGLNAHHDTPRSPWDRQVGHIPGGSSSGTAVAVADGMAAAGLGTDTGGSCRIPAAFCGIVGYKPTARRVPLEGIVPLAPSLDSVGPLARSVECCAILDDVFAGGDGHPGSGSRPPERIRLAAIEDYVLDGLDGEVAHGFERGISRLSAAGVQVVGVPFPELAELPSLYAKGGLAAAEAYHWHRRLLAERGDGYDQRIRVRIEPGGELSAADYLEIVEARRRMIAVAAERLAGFDAYVLPTVAVLPPAIASFDSGDPAHYSRANLACLRNTMVGNFLDACAISLPLSDDGEPPVGLMLMAGPLADHQLFSLARTVESLL
jgi:aspartyl-tRNA(Asn)/glutamyl-tRNA(Gln) amidotransferase subunit A